MRLLPLAPPAHQSQIKCCLLWCAPGSQSVAEIRPRGRKNKGSNHEMGPPTRIWPRAAREGKWKCSALGSHRHLVGLQRQRQLETRSQCLQGRWHLQQRQHNAAQHTRRAPGAAPRFITYIKRPGGHIRYTAAPGCPPHSQTHLDRSSGTSTRPPSHQQLSRPRPASSRRQRAAARCPRQL